MLGPAISATATNLKRFELTDDPSPLLLSLGYEQKLASGVEFAHCRIGEEKHVLLFRAGAEKSVALVNVAEGLLADSSPNFSEELAVFEHVADLIDHRRKKLNLAKLSPDDFF